MGKMTMPGGVPDTDEEDDDEISPAQNKLREKKTRLSFEAPESEEENVPVPQDGFVQKTKQLARSATNAGLHVLHEIMEDQEIVDKEKKKNMEEAALRAAAPRNVRGFDPASLGPFRRKLYAYVTHSAFDTGIGMIIVLNGGTIALEAINSSHVPLGCSPTCVCTNPEAECRVLDEWVNILEQIFYVIYVLEISLRVSVFGPGVVIFNAWTRLDFCLVTAATVDIIAKVVAVSSDALQLIMLFRVLRLLRLARMVRLMIQFQTLWKLVQGLMYSTQTLLWTFVIICGLTYIFALFGMATLQVDYSLPLDHPYNVVTIDNFRDLGDAIAFCFQLFSYDGVASIYRPIVSQTWIAGFYFMAMMLILSVALANMVTAVMVESSLSMAEEDKEVRRIQQIDKKKKQLIKLKEMFLDLDEDGSGEISLDELLDAPDDIMEQLVEIAGTEDIETLFKMLDYDGGGTLGVTEFCEGVFRTSQSEKPIELNALLKQCHEILLNTRSIASVVDPGHIAQSMSRRSLLGLSNRKSAFAGNQVGNNDTDDALQSPSNTLLSTPSKGSAPAKSKDPQVWLADLQERIENLETTCTSMQASTKKILHGLGGGPPVKRAMAVCLGKASGDLDSLAWQRPGTALAQRPGTSQSQRPGTSQSQRPATADVYAWKAGTSPGSNPVDEVSGLRRRVAQLEALLAEANGTIDDVHGPRHDLLR